MPFHIESIETFIRPLTPGRMVFSIGKQEPGFVSGVGAKTQPPRRPGGVALCRLTLKTDDGRTVIGCSGDRPSYGWLDKRPERDPLTKLRALIDLMHAARDVWMENPTFDSLFDHWLDRHGNIMQIGAERDHEALTASFASAFIERALIDAICRASDNPLWSAIKQGQVDFHPESVHPELKGYEIAKHLPSRPRTQFLIRHTVGLSDPLTNADISERVDDGEPESLEEFAKRDGLRYFKVKISGNPEEDIARLRKIWEVIPKTPQTAVTLDGNEAYRDLGAFAGFVDHLEAEAPGLFDHLLFIEQPLTRELTLDPASKPWIAKISAKKSLVIDEADGELSAFRDAHAIGYAGTSHKNCKGFYKSLMNRALCHFYENRDGADVFLTGEDLSLMPIVPLHQDFAALGVLGIEHCERNGHHYSYGLSHLTKEEKAMMLRDHPDLYVKRHDEVFLNIVNGSVSCASLQVPGFGVKTLPDWSAMEPMQSWIDSNYPA
ncbi:MAG: hypothetical protein KDN20_25760 [Verrucomicrobiae bacterium]|nr:hypothetical protein [Verrucomicrobiae bacterium]